MKNNLGKTEILVLSQGKNIQNMKILIEDVEKVTIKSKASIKILGVIVDDKLRCSKQVSPVPDVRFTIFFISSLFQALGSGFG